MIEEPRRSIFVFALPKLRVYILENFPTEEQGSNNDLMMSYVSIRFV